MKKQLLLILGIGISLIMQAQISKTINITTAGSLNTALTAIEKSTVTNLTVTGIIDASDFKTMRDSMPAIIDIDLSGSAIVAYNGLNGPTSLTVYLANTVPTNAFFDFKNYSRAIASIVLPLSTITIGGNAFNSLRELKTFTIPSTVTTIGMSVFQNCAGLTSITIPASVSTIGFDALSSSGLKEIIVDAANTTYSSDNGVLFNKDKTKIVQFPEAKDGNYSIPNTVTNIGNVSFYDNTLTNIYIPNSVITIESQAFNWGNGNLVVDANNTKFMSEDGVLYNKNKTSIIDCPKYKTGNFNIPSTVDTISQGAFSGCKYLESIEIPSSVTTIQSIAFYSCTGLKSLYANSITPIVLGSSNDFFNYVDKTACTLYVPIGSKALYSSANGWKDFTNNVETTSLSATDISSINDDIVSLYPNPTKTGFTINTVDNSLLQIYSLNGELIFNAYVSNKERISTNSFQPGIYIVTIINKKETITKSLIVE